MKEVKKVVTSNRLLHFMQKLVTIEKSKKYIEKELPRLREKEWNLRDKIKKERKAIALVNRARKLR